MPLKTVEPHGLNVIGDEEWVEIDVAVDSGATETVLDLDALEGVVEVIEGPAFTRGGSSMRSRMARPYRTLENGDV